METRLYFLLGDLVANAFLGALLGLACAGLVGESWHIAPAMLLGMLLGMVLAFPAAVLSGICLGAFEVMLPMMLTGMVSGMVTAMTASVESLSLIEGTRLGAVLGLATLAFTYLANAALRGEVRRWTS